MLYGVLTSAGLVSWLVELMSHPLYLLWKQSGSPLILADLKKVSVSKARAIIVLASDENADQSDARALRVVLSLTGVKEGLRSHAVVEMSELDNEPLVKLVGGELIENSFFLFQRQWQKVCDYARIKEISIMGNMPIYVGYHSADVWANKKLFLLNMSGFPLLVSGVSPDAFSETGQLWGSPLYDWKAMEKYGFSWWICRIRHAQNLFDEFGIDHFRGFAGFWAVPSEAKIAMVGLWKVGPRKSLFDAIFRYVGKINITAVYAAQCSNLKRILPSYTDWELPK